MLHVAHIPLTFYGNGAIIPLTFYIFKPLFPLTFYEIYYLCSLNQQDMYFARRIDPYLLEWRNSNRHKPLLLRGARQVGKSSSIRHLGETFDYFIEVNFERQPELSRLFEETSDVKEIVRRLSALFNTPVQEGRTLLFMDEIQACPKALHSLWFFKEELPGLHVAAAGSLLEFTLKEMPSFGVGRIRSMFMYPMSFDEFLTANGKQQWVDIKNAADYDHPLPSELHNALVQQFRTFLMVGGMPASVAAWVETHDYLESAEELEDIQRTYYDDFVKYSKKIDPRMLRNTLRSVVMQAGAKFMYSKVEGGYRTEDVKAALEMLCDAGIVKLVQHSAGNGIPLGAEVNDKFRKYIYLDSGLMLRILDMELGGAGPLTELILSGAAADLVNKGQLTEMVAGWEIIKSLTPKMDHDLYYWENTARGATAEIDYLTSSNLKVVPIEIKSGITGKMKSLMMFMRNKHLTVGKRCSLENFGTIEFTDSEDAQNASVAKRVLIHPLYCLGTLMGACSDAPSSTKWRG